MMFVERFSARVLIDCVRMSGFPEMGLLLHELAKKEEGTANLICVSSAEHLPFFLNTADHLAKTSIFHETK